MPGVKEVAQVAACVGREFSYPLLEAISPLSEAKLHTALRRLATAELIFSRGKPPEASYTFKHALVRDAAHESLLKTRRQQLHASIVHALEEHFPETVETEPEFLARHCGEAGLVGKAVEYWQSAANYVLVRVGEAAPTFVEALAARKIHVRDRSRDPHTRGCIRITAGVIEHTDAAVEALESVVAARAGR